MCPAAMQVYWNNKTVFTNKERAELPQDWFGATTWPQFHCFTNMAAMMSCTHALYFVNFNGSGNVRSNKVFSI